MEYALILTAITLGLATSMHCIGMCGPIAFSLGLNPKNKLSFVTKNLTYQFGRVLTYTSLGVIAGFVGKGIQLAGFQQYLSISVGVLLIAMIFVPRNLAAKGMGKGVIGRLLIKIKSGLGNYLRKKTYPALLITGLLNGLLPCGPVYVALAASLAAGSVIKSATFMTLFGLGTIPLMFSAVFFGSVVSQSIRGQVLKYLPVLTFIVGVLFILRGLDVSIPFISPPVEALKVGGAACCH